MNADDIRENEKQKAKTKSPRFSDPRSRRSFAAKYSKQLCAIA